MNQRKPDQAIDQTSSQLKVLGQINHIFQSHQVNFWLRGGWAIDFLLGKITRPHSDIDLVTWVKDRLTIEHSLENVGFQKIPISELQTDFLINGIDISICYITKSIEGKIIANGIPDWEWRQDALPTKQYLLNGVSAFTLSPQQLLEEKEVYEEGTGRKPRPKDYESMKILREIIEKNNLKN